MKFILKEDGRRLFFVVIASFIMAINIKSFVQTGGLYPGGATGLTLLIIRSAKIYLDLSLPYTLVNLLLNAIPIYIGFRFLGKKFTIYSCIMIVLTSVLTDLLPSYVITYDTLLIAIFGGIISGFAISLCLSENFTTGGTDFIGIYFSEKKGVDAWNMILGFNVIILIVAGFEFGWDKALYSIIFQYASTEVLHLLFKKFQQETLFIVTNNATRICEIISKISGHGATIIDAMGPYENKDRKIVYSVVSSAESKKVINAVREADEHAFVNIMKTERVAGRFYFKPYE